MIWFANFIIANITSRWEIRWSAEIAPRKLYTLYGIERARLEMQPSSVCELGCFVSELGGIFVCELG